MLPNGWKVEFLAAYPNLRRKAGLGISFVAVGSVACLSAIALLVTENDPGIAFPMPPQETASRTVTMAFTNPERRPLDMAAAEKTTAIDPKAKCERDCDVMAARAQGESKPKAAPFPAQPVAATEPAVLPAGAPPENESAPESIDSPAPLPPIAPAMAESAAPKPPKAQRRQSRSRNSFDGFPLFAFDHRGRPRFRPLFW
jgi:hypothetical protein